MLGALRNIMSAEQQLIIQLPIDKQLLDFNYTVEAESMIYILNPEHYAAIFQTYKLLPFYIQARY
jgi:hypothetical protein